MMDDNAYIRGHIILLAVFLYTLFIIIKTFKRSCDGTHMF